MFSSNDIETLVTKINDIAKGAGKKIRQYFNSDYEVDYKNDHSPVTTADLAAHEYIENQLATLTPELPLLSEESAQSTYTQRRSWQTYWLVDPLDGTREFIKHNADFTVNIALIHLNQPILGVIHLPMEDSIYFATIGNGAFRSNGSDARVPIAVSSTVTGAPRVCGSRANPGKSMQKFLYNVGDHDLIARGSSIKSCLVAEGSADIYPRFGPTWEWDTAAAQCIVEQAGGKLTDLNLQTLKYNKESLLNPSFMVYGDQKIDWQKLL